MLYTMVTAYMLGPMLSYKLGIPRIDNPLTLLLVPATLLIFFIENKTFNSKAGLMLMAVGLMTGWSAIHLFITPLDSVRVMDPFFFLSIAGLFYLLYLILSRHENPLRFIRRLLVYFCAFIIIPPVIEVLTGIQFVKSDEILAIEYRRQQEGIFVRLDFIFEFGRDCFRQRIAYGDDELHYFVYPELDLP